MKWLWEFITRRFVFWFKENIYWFLWFQTTLVELAKYERAFWFTFVKQIFVFGCEGFIAIIVHLSTSRTSYPFYYFIVSYQ
jgi:hypothetical protein